MTEIVRGDASRIDELEPLWLALREHHGSVTEHWGPLREPADSWERRRKMYADILAEGGSLHLAVDDGRVIGLAMCEREEFASPTWQWPSSLLAVVDLVVLEAARAQGVGALLLESVEADARERGVDAVDLMVAAPNAGARRFYERHGFREDLVTLRKPL
ncbi:MAG TPA: GNAT family N-acetyltransferase [Solirubrobacteraceae bacterium]